jgi:hypothetical protein
MAHEVAFDARLRHFAVAPGEQGRQKAPKIARA